MSILSLLQDFNLMKQKQEDICVEMKMLQLTTNEVTSNALTKMPKTFRFTDTSVERGAEGLIELAEKKTPEFSL